MFTGQVDFGPDQFRISEQHRPRVADNSHHDLHSNPSAHNPMDDSHFSDFNFSYHALPNQSSMVALPDQFSGPAVDAFAHQVSITSASHSMSIPAATLPTSDHVFHPQSIDGSDDGDKDGSSPMVNSLDDSVADEFGLAVQGRADGTDLGVKAKDGKADAPPAWTELKTKAGKERKRLPLACIACRRKKIRCSGEKPACKHCLRSRIPCVYKVTTRKAAPRTDYMSMLDKRLKRMEERIIKVIPKAEQDSTSVITRAVVKPAIPAMASNKATSKKRRADEAFGPDLEAWAAGSSKLSAADEQRRKSFEVQEAEDDALLHDGNDELPSKDVQEHLAEVYFENVYGQAYHLLHKPSYMRKLKNNTLPPVLVLSVCAVAARFSTNPKLNSTTRHFLRGEEWASHARNICTKRYEWPNITILTCLLILGLHEFGTCQGGRSWALGGQAIRMAFALQLHKDLEYDPNSRNGHTKLSFIDREIRRRIMWSCFLMDRFNSSGMDRPMFVKEETVDLPLPVKERYFQLDMPVPTETLSGKIPSSLVDDEQMLDVRDNMGVAAYFIRSVALWGRIITYFSEGGPGKHEHSPIWNQGSEFDTLAKEAEALLQTLPECLAYSSDNLEVHITDTTANQYILLHLSLQQNNLFLHRGAASHLTTRIHEGAPDGFVAEAHTKTVLAANRISEILKDAETAQCFVSAPFAGYCAYSSATVHVNGITSRNPQVRSTAEINSGTNVKFLRKMMKHWGVFHWMVESIRMQYRIALDAARSGTPARDVWKMSSVLHYGDWFSRYPHGISDAEFMDPTASKKKERGADGVLEQKSELQSVEEYFETLSPPQSTGSRDGAKASTLKKTTSARRPDNNGARTSQPHLEPLVTNLRVSPVPQPGSGHPQHRRLSGAVGAQPTSAAAFNPLVAQHTQNSSYHTLSPISPVVSQFSSQGHGQTSFFSPSMLSLGVPQSSNGMMHGLDGQFMYGSYPMEPSGMASTPGMVSSVTDWDGLSIGGQTAQGSHHGRGPKGALGGRQMQDHGGLGAPSMHGAGRHEDPGAWFMPFGMDTPDMGQDLGFGVGTVDAYGGMLGGSGSGMTTPNPLTGLHHGP
ncbi:hypothetical protein S40293_06816 [Stachybotrys chartarum IBT 40293]|nr:hypothetical protein S40293_06816 [Stachybotrys chartarum IBT 40293]